MSRGRVIGGAFVVVVAGVTAACATPGTGPQEPAPPSPARTGVAPGCDPATSPVRWSEPTRRPLLTRVTLFRTTAGDGASPAGTDVFAEPFAPAVAQVAAPAGWIPVLAKSLGAHTGETVHSEPAVLQDGGYGTEISGGVDPGIPETLLYEAVDSVSARFVVECAAPVAGVFTSWTSLRLEGVACGAVEEPAGPVGRLARSHCPRTPAPRSS